MIALWALSSAFAGDVVVWHAYSGAEERALVQVAANYEAETGQKVVPLAVPWGAFDSKVETAVPRGNGPDLVITAHTSIGKWSAMGLIEPVTAPLGLRSFTTDALTLDSRLWGVPIAFKSPVLLYDPSQVTVVPTTTDELLAQVKAHTGNGDYGLVYEAATPYYHAAWLHGFGGAAYGPEGKASLDSPADIAALTFVQALGPYLPVRPTAERVGQLYDEGHAAFVISGPWFVADRQRPVAAAPLPIVSETGQPARPYLTVDAAMVCAGADDKEPALAFAAYLAGPAGAVVRRDVGGQAVSDESTDLSQNPLLAVLAAQAQTAIPMPTDPGVQNVFEAESRALRRVLRGAATPEQAAAEAQAWYTSLVHPRPAPVEPLPYIAVGTLMALAGLVWVGRGLREPAIRHQVRVRIADYAWIAPAALTVGLLVVVPFLVGATVSLYAHDNGQWTFIGLKNFADILLSRDWPITSPMSFFYTLAVTVLWTVTNVALHVGLGVALALILREPWVKLQRGWRAVLVLPWAVPNYITALIWRAMFDAQYGAVNALLSAVLGKNTEIDWFGQFSTAFCANLATNTWLGFPFMMVVTLGALAAIPRDLEEAAAIDGATYWQRLRHVVWPQLKPALLPAVVMGSVWTFNLFNVIYLVSSGEPDGSTEILISQAYRWAFSRGNQYGYASAYAVIIFFVLLMYSRVTERWLKRVTA